MLWQIEIGMKPNLADPMGLGARNDILDLGIKNVREVRFIRIYVLEADLDEAEISRIITSLLVDPAVNDYACNQPMQILSGKNIHVISIFLNRVLWTPCQPALLKPLMIWD